MLLLFIIIFSLKIVKICFSHLNWDSWGAFSNREIISHNRSNLYSGINLQQSLPVIWLLSFIKFLIEKIILDLLSVFVNIIRFNTRYVASVLCNTRYVASVLCNTRYVASVLCNTRYVASVLCNTRYVASVLCNTRYVASVLCNTRYVASVLCNTRYVASVLCNTRYVASVLCNTRYVASVLCNTRYVASVLCNTRYVASVLCNTRYVASVLCNTRYVASVLCNTRYVASVLCNTRYVASVLCNSLCLTSVTEYTCHIWLHFIIINRSGDVEENPGPHYNSCQSFSILYWNPNSIFAHNFIKLSLFCACLSETFWIVVFYQMMLIWIFQDIIW